MQQVSNKSCVCPISLLEFLNQAESLFYYLYEHLQILKDVKVDIVMPTGAMGNITGGYIAKKVGVPLGFLCSGVNVNDITHRVMQTGKFHKSDAMEKTLSDAINIQVVSDLFGNVKTWKIVKTLILIQILLLSIVIASAI